MNLDRLGTQLEHDFQGHFLHLYNSTSVDRIGEEGTIYRETKRRGLESGLTLEGLS